MAGTAYDAYPLAPSDAAHWIAGLDLALTIDGRDAPPARVRHVVDPCTEQQGAAYADAEIGHVDLAVAAAKAAFPAWAATAWETRRAALERFAELMLAHRDTLSIIVAIETGRPLWRAGTR